MGDDGGDWTTDEPHRAGDQAGDGAGVLSTRGVGRAVGDVEQEGVQ